MLKIELIEKFINIESKLNQIELENVELIDVY